MKILKDKYPKGTFPRQQTDGRYIDEYLYKALQDLAKVIVKDMTFLGVIYSSTLEVGTGKSVLATQMGEAWGYIMKEMHNIDLPFTTNNIVWRPKQLIERSFQVPKYSYILLDEWEDAHYWSELGMTFRQFFRKCRQLNLFIMVIIPNWFQLPIFYAVGRSVFAIDVRFETGFTRGYFSFYAFPTKRRLYIEGKKTHWYGVVKPDFVGRFGDGYGVPRSEYLEAKAQDLRDYEATEPQRKTEAILKEELYFKLKQNPELSTKILAKAFEISERTGQRWVVNQKLLKESEIRHRQRHDDTYSRNIIDKSDLCVDDDEGESKQKNNLIPMTQK